ncbi:MAG TPA: PQQ-binding-like beta-propeller repeat protein [Candidatus Acidoferrum sp.]|nr:PQQ-binding-like beta-propeller repeat protein [Candidatus Acidoferrum sp.]
MKADNFSPERRIPTQRPARPPRCAVTVPSPAVGRALPARRNRQPSPRLAFPGPLAAIVLLFCLTACSPEKDPRPQPAIASDPVPSKPAAPAPPSWPIFRGNPALTGVANDTLPQKPAVLWTFKTGGPVKSSPVIGAGKIFIGSDDGNVYAVNFGDGKPVWAFKADSAVQAPPLFVNNCIFAGSVAGAFYALDAGAGGLLWQAQTDGKILASASVVARADGPPRILIGSYDFKLRCLDAAKGATNWLFESGNYINGACAVADGRAVFGGCDSMLHVLQAGDGKEISQIEAGAFIGASVALAGNRAYFGHYDNEFLCVDLARTNVVWHFHDQDFPFMSSAAVTQDRVLFGGYDKTLHCLNRADGKSLWSFPAHGKIESSPVVAGDKVVFGSDDGRVYLLALADGRELWSYDTGQPVASSPAVAGNRIVIGCDDGNVYCFGAKEL